jgi:hypothetical protein
MDTSGASCRPDLAFGSHQDAALAGRLVVKHMLDTGAYLLQQSLGIRSTPSFIQLIWLGQRQRVGEIIEQQWRAVLMPQIGDELAARNRTGVFFGLWGLVGVTTGDRHAEVSFPTWRAVSLQVALGSIIVLTAQMCRCSLVDS